MIYEYLNKEYNRTKWPYFGLMELKYKFGKNISDELNKLREEGKVTKRAGINYPLVLLLVTDDGEIIEIP